jgi:hypothetical protein
MEAKNHQPNNFFERVETWKALPWPTTKTKEQLHLPLSRVESGGDDDPKLKGDFLWQNLSFQAKLLSSIMLFLSLWL